MTLKTSRTHNLILCALFTTLIIIGAFVKIPIGPVPVTLQTLFVLLSFQILGRKSSVSVLVYIFLGLIGLPVFSGGGGIGYIFNITFGYLLGFLAGSYVLGFFCERIKKNAFFVHFLLSLVALLIIYTFGTGYFCLISKLYMKEQIDFLKVVTGCILVFLPSDLVFCIISSFISIRINKVLKT